MCFEPLFRLGVSVISRLPTTSLISLAMYPTGTVYGRPHSPSDYYYIQRTNSKPAFDTRRVSSHARKEYKVIDSRVH